MLGLSLSKILYTIMIVIAVWKGFALISRLANERQAAVKRRRAGPARGTSRRAEPEPGAIELRECPRCGAYIDPRENCSCGLRGNDARRTNS